MCLFDNWKFASEININKTEIFKWKMKMEIMENGIYYRQKFVLQLAFNRTRFSNIWCINEQYLQILYFIKYIY